MHRRTFLGAATGLLAGCATRQVPRAQGPGPNKQRGIAYDAFRGRPHPDDFARIRDLGATHLALFPFGYMERHTEPVVHRFADDVDHSVTDEGLTEAARLARAAGLRVIFVPTLEDFRDGHWRGEVRMTSEADWAAWFASYERFLLHYARLARAVGAVGLSIGTELRETAHREREWRGLIARARETFPGWLTYAANWDDYAAVRWWDAVDYLGVQAYFELGDPGAGPRDVLTDRLTAAWGPIRAALQAESRRWDMPVLFTEIGYKSHTGATAHPWDWSISGEPAPELQAAAYEATFRALWDQPWFAGCYWWKWHAGTAPIPDPARNFTPQGKPAAGVLRRHYRP